MLNLNPEVIKRNAYNLFLRKIVLGWGEQVEPRAEKRGTVLMPSIYILITDFTTSLVEMMVYSHLPESLLKKNKKKKMNQTHHSVTHNPSLVKMECHPRLNVLK